MLFHVQQAGGSWLTALHLILAALVTGHVLLSKRDVAASIGWIGLSWLSPILGSLIYFSFGINRVRRMARLLRGRRPARLAAPDMAARIAPEDHLVGLWRAGGRLTGRRPEPGNAIRVLQNGDEAYPLMIAAIEAAQSSVVLSTYILRSDGAGGGVIDALIGAARRGVAVRVLVDGIGSGYFLSPAYRRLRRGGVPAARFLHSSLPWRTPFLNLRIHKKILVVDGRTGFTGGLNIGDENLLSTKPDHPVQDTHFRVEGPVVAQLGDAFAVDWSFTTGAALADAVPPGPAPAGGTATARVVTSGPDEDLEKIEFLVLEAVASARQAIRILTPYFLPDERLTTALALASMRGVAVELIVPKRSNRPVVDWATRAHVGPLLAAGCRLWYGAAPFDHSKIMTVDGTWCLVGSANWDVRSFRLNFELDLEVYDAELAGRLDALMAAKQARPITAEALRRRGIAIRLRDAGSRLLLPYL